MIRKQEQHAAQEAALHNKRLAKKRVELLRFIRESGFVAVDASKLAPDNSYCIAPFVERGYYTDEPFQCKNCRVMQVWTAKQQKWWYEIAQGSRWTTARFCRACRRKERERKARARQVHLEGLAKKKKSP